MRMEAAGRLRTALSATVLAGLALVGCSGDTTEPAGLDQTDSPAPAGNEPRAATPESEPDDEADDHVDEPSDQESTQGADASDSGLPNTDISVGAGGQTHQFPEAGLTIVEPSDIPEDAGPAVAVYIDYLRERRTALREVEFDERIEELAYPSLVDSLESSIDYQAENGLRYSGELIVHLELEHSDEFQVLLGGCLDGTDLTFVDDAGEHPVRGEQGNATAVISAMVDPQLGQWMVSEDVIENDEPC
ncbi:hypothetical protein [Phytoactinopolyspora limicola]|uniref:hypothetical protein n=1 Tax=Phytoactinopolyspora limicola TaxID=2715536 RepID=UPI00140AF7EE|nr:hypothetical protein [Phytoactinopolyspora limicola]